MQSIQNYLDKNKIIPIIPDLPSLNLGIVVVIPCFNELFVLETLETLRDCAPAEVDVEVIIVINDSEVSTTEIKAQNKITYEEVKTWASLHNNATLVFRPIYCTSLPKKHAGVGLARKIGMDEAVWRFAKINNDKGIIVNLDADSTCSKNYFTAIEQHFNRHPKTPGASIYFEHPLDHSGILQYELHLRYLNQALRLIGHPHAFHTVGSCFAVRLSAYARQGGMNKRQAGEDFYFIQKIVWLGHFTEINTTCVIPSSRVSDRVPFGTGAAMKKLEEEKEDTLLTYNFQAFRDLKSLFNLIEPFFYTGGKISEALFQALSPALKKFLIEINYEAEIASIKNNTAGLPSFTNRFFLWFDVFRVIKFLNCSHNSDYKKGAVVKEAKKLLVEIDIDMQTTNSQELLRIFRELDKKARFNCQ
jgi:glycosyltransferase involved in cell wall biosynthesis